MQLTTTTNTPSSAEKFTAVVMTVLRHRPAEKAMAVLRVIRTIVGARAIHPKAKGQHIEVVLLPEEYTEYKTLIAEFFPRNQFIPWGEVGEYLYSMGENGARPTVDYIAGYGDVRFAVGELAFMHSECLIVLEESKAASNEQLEQLEERFTTTTPSKSSKNPWKGKNKNRPVTQKPVEEAVSVRADDSPQNQQEEEVAVETAVTE